MKEAERKPVLSEAEGLTKIVQPPYARGGDIFMAENGEGKDMSPNSQPTSPESGAEKIPAQQPVSAENQATARKLLTEFPDLPIDVRKAAEQIVAGENVPLVSGGAPEPGKPEEPPPSPPQGEQPAQQPKEEQGEGGGVETFGSNKDIPNTEEDYLRQAQKKLVEEFRRIDASSDTPEQKNARKNELLEQEIERIRKQSGELRAIEEQIRRGLRYPDMINLEDSFNLINRAIAEGKIDVSFGEKDLAELAKRGREMAERRAKERYPEQILLADEISRLEGYTRTQRLKAEIDKLDQDEPIQSPLLRVIALDQEASEKLVNKIITKPFTAEASDYRLSWYAEINLQSFLTAVNNLGDVERFKRYVNQGETALRLHEMNRATTVMSGNIEGFQNMARVVTPRHLQTGAEIDGVGYARNLLEMAFGRLYTAEGNVRQELYEPEILNWAKAEFEEVAASGVIRSSFNGEDGRPRNLERWEIDRAFALARNFESSFYRTAELVSWGVINKPFEEWLKSMPAETIVRVMGGIKMLDQRFRVGKTRGGPMFVSLLFDGLKKEYKGRLKKLGKIDIADDLLPVGVLKAGGFDKGWRPFGAYLGSDLMRIDISSLTVSLPENLSVKLEKGSKGESLRRFIVEVNKGERNIANLATFLAYNAEFAYEYHGQNIEIDGVSVPKELASTDFKKAAKDMEQLIFPLLGFTPKDVNAADRIKDPKYEFNMADFNYSIDNDQVNFSLGVLINSGGISENVKAALWVKTAKVLPLRIAYFLSEEGVRDLPNYSRFKGEHGALFNKTFEKKLIRLHFLRMEEQKRIAKEESRSHAFEAKDFFTAAGLDADEQEFVIKLQGLGEEKAGELAKIPFPQIAFLDDVPFQEASYIKLGAEVFPRRMGSDFRGYSEATSGATGVVNNLGAREEEIDKHLAEMMESVAGPEGIDTGQDVVYKFYKVFLRMEKQWEWTKIPGVKTVRSFMNKPTSFLQTLFGPSAPSKDEGALSIKVRDLASKGIIRFQKLPGEKESQMKSMLREVHAKPSNVFLREFINALLAYLMYLTISFPGKVASEKR